MLVNIGIPESEISKPVLDAGLEAVTRLNEQLIRSGKAPDFSAQIKAGLRWAPEPPGQESFDHAGITAKRMWADCDDLAPLHAATLRVRGIDPGAKAVVYKSGPSMWHAVTERSDGSFQDPSQTAGMKVRPGGHAAGIPAAVVGCMSVVGGAAIPDDGMPLIAIQDNGSTWVARSDLPIVHGPLARQASLVVRKSATTPAKALAGSVLGACILGASSRYTSKRHLDKLWALSGLLQGKTVRQCANVVGDASVKDAIRTLAEICPQILDELRAHRRAVERGYVGNIFDGHYDGGVDPARFDWTARPAPPEEDYRPAPPRPAPPVVNGIRRAVGGPSNLIIAASQGKPASYDDDGGGDDVAEGIGAILGRHGGHHGHHHGGRHGGGGGGGGMPGGRPRPAPPTGGGAAPDDGGGDAPDAGAPDDGGGDAPDDGGGDAPDDGGGAVSGSNPGSRAAASVAAWVGRHGGGGGSHRHHRRRQRVDADTVVFDFGGTLNRTLGGGFRLDIHGRRPSSVVGGFDLGRMVKSIVDDPGKAARDAGRIVKDPIRALNDVARTASNIVRDPGRDVRVIARDVHAVEVEARTIIPIAEGIVQSVVSLVPGLGPPISSALAAGMAALEGDNPLEIAMNAALGLIPLPPGVEEIAKGIMDALLTIAMHPNAGGAIDAAIVAAKANIPGAQSGLIGQVFDTLSHLVLAKMRGRATTGIVVHRPGQPTRVVPLTKTSHYVNLHRAAPSPPMAHVITPPPPPVTQPVVALAKGTPNQYEFPDTSKPAVAGWYVVPPAPPGFVAPPAPPAPMDYVAPPSGPVDALLRQRQEHEARMLAESERLRLEHAQLVANGAAESERLRMEYDNHIRRTAEEAARIRNEHRRVA